MRSRRVQKRGLRHAGSRQRFLVDEVVEDLGDAQAVDERRALSLLSRSGWLGRLGYHTVLASDRRSRAGYSLPRPECRGCAVRARARRSAIAPGVAENLTGRPSVCTCADHGMLDHRHHVARLGLRDARASPGRTAPVRPARRPSPAAPAIRRVVRCWKWGVSSAISSGRLAMRPALSAKRASPAISGASSTLQELQPGLLVGGAECDPAVLGLERLVGRAERMRRAQRPRRHAGGEGDGRLPVGLDDAGLEQRGVDALALPGLELVRVGGGDAHGGEQAGGDVGDRRTDLDRRPARPFAGDRHQARHALRDEVEAALVGQWAGAAEARDLAIDEARIDWP